MREVSQETWEYFDRRLDGAAIPERERPKWRKWVRYYLDFCHKYGHGPRLAASIGPFLEKLASKGQSADQREQASRAVHLLISARRDLGAGRAGMADSIKAGSVVMDESDEESAIGTTRAKEQAQGVKGTIGESTGGQAGPAAGDPAKEGTGGTEVSGPPAFGQESALGDAGAARGGSTARGGPSWAEQYDELERAIKMRHYSTKTFSAYRLWVRKFQGFVRNKPPEVLDGGDVKGFLSDLAVRLEVAASTQNQAFNALLFFYRHVLGREFGKLEGVVRAKRRPYVPVVLSRPEVDAVLAHLDPPYRLVASLLYGCGLRLSECLSLRIHCFNLDAMILTVHDGKGQKDRTVPLPERVSPEIRRQMEAVGRLHREDLAVAGYAGVFLPRQLEKKYKNAAREYIWQWFFPAVTLTEVPGTGERRRYHLHDSHVQGAVKRAAASAGVPKRVSPHTFRHTFASHLLLAKYDIHTIQKLLGHSDVKTTMIYTQTVPSVTLKNAKSPLDLDLESPSPDSGEQR